jgi:hypothetical protein
MNGRERWRQLGADTAARGFALTSVLTGIRSVDQLIKEGYFDMKEGVPPPLPHPPSINRPPPPPVPQDDLSNRLRLMSAAELFALAKANDVWHERYCAIGFGLARMQIGNALRGRLKRGIPLKSANVAT